MTPLFRWDGTYVGFRIADHLYAADGSAFGWVDEDGRAWRADGSYLGSVFEGSYILREPGPARHAPAHASGPADAARRGGEPPPALRACDAGGRPRLARGRRGAGRGPAAIRLVTPLFRWDGRHVGFRSGDHLYTRSGNCFGWVDDDGTVWRADGSYLGELMHDNYVLRSKRLREGSRRTGRRMDPPRAVTTTDVADRPARMISREWTTRSSSSSNRRRPTPHARRRVRRDPGRGESVRQGAATCSRRSARRRLGDRLALGGLLAGPKTAGDWARSLTREEGGELEVRVTAYPVTFRRSRRASSSSRTWASASDSSAPPANTAPREPRPARRRGRPRLQQRPRRHRRLRRGRQAAGGLGEPGQRRPRRPALRARADRAPSGGPG